MFNRYGINWGGTLVLVLSAHAMAAAGEPTRLRSTMQTLKSQELLEQVNVGAQVRLDNVVLDGQHEPVVLELERFEVFAPDARVVVHRRNGGKRTETRPAEAYFRGAIASDPDSVAVVSADRSGGMRGIVRRAERTWLLTGGSAGGPAQGLASTELLEDYASAPAQPFRCDLDQLPSAPRRLARSTTAGVVLAQLAPDQVYEAKVGIETDAEFFNLFGSSTGATSYIGNLFAYASTIYEREIGTRLTVGYVSLWSGGPTADPWNHTSTSQGLTDFGNYWKRYRSGVQRSVAHFLSGRNLGGGIAWVGALCTNDYGYGYSGSIGGNFQLSNPKPLWDIIVITHEIGHNFDSPHTHDYQYIGGDPNPIDACATQSVLPGLSSLSGGVPGSGNGTIMSYCHLLSGGYQNINLSFGQSHPYGIKAYRERDQMAAYVAQVASNYPSCITVATTSSQPDFAVTGITVNPATPTANGTFSAQVTIKNQGGVSGNAGQLGIWVDQTAAPPCNATPNASLSIGTLAAGVSATHTVSGLSAGTPGAKTLRAFVDKDCSAPESSEANNQATLAYTVGAAAGSPDLIVSSVALNPAVPSANGTFSASVTVKNQGTASGTGGYLAVWADQGTAQSCGLLGNKYVSVGTLAAGASATYTVTGLSASIPGEKILRAFVDSLCRTTESVEDNNQLTQTYTVGGADLVVTGISLNPSPPVLNGTFSALVTVRNQGTAAGAGGYLAVWANQPATQSCGLLGDRYIAVGTLAAGASTTLTVTGLSASAPGDRVLRAVVDSFCQTPELAESNNQSTQVYTVGGADLVVTGVALNPEAPSANAAFSASVTVRNQGTAAGTGGNLAVWANQPAAANCNAFGNKNVSVGTLAAGATATYTVTGLSVPTAGEKVFRAFLDSYCRTPELIEGNNQFTQAYSAGGPDFVVTGVTLSPETPRANGTFNANVTVMNQGTGSGAGGYLSVWANQTAVQSCYALGNRFVALGTLAAGASATYSLTGLPAGAAGSKNLRAFADSYCQASEMDEGNNQFSLTYAVGP